MVKPSSSKAPTVLSPSRVQARLRRRGRSGLLLSILPDVLLAPLAPRHWLVCTLQKIKAVTEEAKMRIRTSRYPAVVLTHSWFIAGISVYGHGSTAASSAGERRL